MSLKILQLGYTITPSAALLHRPSRTLQNRAQARLKGNFTLHQLVTLQFPIIGTCQSGGALASPFRKCKESLSKTGQNSK